MSAIQGSRMASEVAEWLESFSSSSRTAGICFSIWLRSRSWPFSPAASEPRARLWIEEVHDLVEVDGGGGVLQWQRTARGDGSAARWAGGQLDEGITEQALGPDGGASPAMKGGGAPLEFQHHLGSTLARAVVGGDGDGRDLADARAVDHHIVLGRESFCAEEIGGHGIGVIAEEIAQQPSRQPSGCEEREQQLHRLFPRVCSSRSVRSCGAVGVPPPRPPGHQPDGWFSG